MMRLSPKRYVGRPFLAALLTVSISLLLSAAWAETPDSGRLTRERSHGPRSGLLRSSDGLAGGRFLVAGRSMADVKFRHAVILLISYGEDGAMGLIVNLPTGVRLSRLFPELKGLHKRPDHVFIGGPVAGNQLFMLVRSASMPEGAHHVFKDTYLSADMSLLEHLSSSAVNKYGRFKIFAGYAGWAPGQLEMELRRGAWHVMTADEETLFDKDPSSIWDELIVFSSGTWVLAY